MRTVLDVITATSAFFQKRGVEEPRLNIELLLAHVLEKKRMELYLEFDRPLGEGELEPLRDLVRRRAEGEPLQHLLGTVEFLGRSFACDRRALVPRPETEQLCELLLDEWKSAPPSRVIDVGTGSGVIALTLAAAWPQAQVEAVDLSREALALAQENAARLGLAERVVFHEGDLLAPIEGEVELIVANLPYIAERDRPSLAREVLRDPPLALFSEGGGFAHLGRLIADAPRILRGQLALEIGCDQGAATRDALAAQGFTEVRIAQDYSRRDRFAFAARAGRESR